MLIIALIMTILAGMAVSFQGPTNTALSRHCGVIQASLISFIGSFIVIFAISAIQGFHIERIIEASWWMLVGGIYGAVIVAATVVIIPKLGAALSGTVMMLAQTAVAFMIETFGWLGSVAVEFDVTRALGCGFIAIGVLCVYRSSALHEAEEAKAAGMEKASFDSKLLPYLFLGLLAGVCAALQAPTNAALSQYVGMMNSAMVSYASGGVILLMLTLVTNKGKINSIKQAKPWELTGGLYGVATVTVIMVAIAAMGVGLAMSIALLAQLTGALIVDTFGWFGVKKIKLDKLRITGVIVVALGIVFVSLQNIL